MKLKHIVHEAALALAKVKYLAGVPILEEEQGDVAKELQLKVAQQRAAILVGWSGFEPTKQSAAEIIGTAHVVASIFERPLVNRRASGAPTLCRMAEEVALALTYAKAEGMDAPLFLERISPISELGVEDGGTVTCDVTFKTTASL